MLSELVEKVRQYNFEVSLDRSEFIERYRRDSINEKMAKLYLKIFMKRVLLTGATGFVGKHLLSDLKFHGFDVQTLNLRAVPLHIDFRNADTLIHLAGKAHDLKNISSSSEYYEINYELTKQVYNSFLASDAKKFIFMSSVKASADEVPEILKESDSTNPKTHYGKSKRLAEEFIINQPLSGDKSFFILRPSMIHGPGNKGNLKPTL
jgi:nucleoside-diphosphate-sugar epimerase